MDDFEPTIMSLQDTVDILKNTYGESWREQKLPIHALMTMAAGFNKEHVEEIIPSMMDIYNEYMERKTVNGEFVNPDCMLIVLDESIRDKKIDYREKFGTSPVRDSYWVIEEKND